jgi:hypothetical protein
MLYLYNNVKMNVLFMKKSIFKVIFASLFVIIAFVGCNEGIEGNQGDTIGLSQKDFTLTNEKQEIQITTKGWEWIFSSYSTSEGINKVLDGNSISFSDTWFEVSRPTQTLINITVEANTSDQARKLQIILAERDYTGYINIEQKP